MSFFPHATTGNIKPGTTVNGVPYTVDEAILVLVNGVQSGSGLARLNTQTGNAAELAAIALLTGSTVDIGPAFASLFNEKLGSALLDTDEWDDVVTALANA